MNDLWIRSQDKEKLVKCDDIAITTDSEDGKTIRGYKIVGYFDKSTEYEILGKYRTKERSLEVMDEIQAIIKGKMLLTLNFERGIEFLVANHSENYAETFLNQIAVYEMPKE